ncbi:MAG TPA: 3-oxoacyl-[acyl-carrier-protein] synthase III C-terminal domain-containing protein [Anaerolineales bacterium]|nr:3-oxoacyl-[acyl-carrier-protein] synthase III C-terminal domain-containing protein [Anaerolineales bacterium]
MDTQTTHQTNVVSFFDRPGVEKMVIPVSGGIPFAFERVTNPAVGIGGVYGTWGDSYDNEALHAFLEKRLGHPLQPTEKLNLSELGFLSRHHVPLNLTDEEHLQIEVEVGAKLLSEAIEACGWKPSEVEAVLIGISAPISADYLDRITKAAGIPESALKVATHKACDGSTSSLHLALNPDLPENLQLRRNIAESLYGKKVLVGGIEGLSRFVGSSHDANALQLFGNAGGVIGIIPGETMKFIAGKSHEVFDDEGVLQVAMYYPHSRRKAEDGTNIDVTESSTNHIRVAGLMHEPADGSSISMAGPMGMVKLFVRTGVQVVREVYAAYQAKLSELGMAGKSLAVAIVHHANYKINKLKEKHLQSEGIVLPMPWVLSEFGNVSAASNMIAFLRELPKMKPFDHILIDGFGAGTYYDALAVELGG